MRARGSGEGGFSAAIFIVLIALMVMLVGGVAVDLWRVLAEHRQVTGLVDGASIAGATAVDSEALYAGEPARLDAALATARTCDYLSRHGVAAPCPGEVEVTVGAETVTVTLRRDVDVTLLALLSLAGGEVAPIEVGATSTAQLQLGTP